MHELNSESANPGSVTQVEVVLPIEFGTGAL